MSIYHIPDERYNASPTRCTVRKMLIENEHFIETITLYQSYGRAADAAKYQELLHRNLVTLARLADAFRESQTIQTLQLNLNESAENAGCVELPEQ